MNIFHAIKRFDDTVAEASAKFWVDLLLLLQFTLLPQNPSLLQHLLSSVFIQPPRHSFCRTLPHSFRSKPPQGMRRR
jgi:hypothetical protein